jgi:hypothetical protein
MEHLSHGACHMKLSVKVFLNLSDLLSESEISELSETSSVTWGDAEHTLIPLWRVERIVMDTLKDSGTAKAVIADLAEKLGEDTLVDLEN